MNGSPEIGTKQIESLLSDRFGLDSETLGSGSLQHALKQRLECTETKDIHTYIELLGFNKAEQQKLVEEILVPETWFFRDIIPFDCLRRFVTDDWCQRSSTRQLRVLSVPCSTGEEPYSIAMTLTDLGLTSSRFHIDGLDLSRSVLGKAVKGIYTKSSLRDANHKYSAILEQGIQRRGDLFAVNSEIRKSVDFRYGNLTVADFLQDEPVYDVIFCRNVLIYFHDQSRKIALSNLHRLLAPGGLLYVGHVEAAIIGGGLFRAFKDFPFAFRPVDDASNEQDNALLTPPRPKILPTSVRNTDIAGQPASRTRRARTETVVDTPVTVRRTQPVAMDAKVSSLSESDEDLLQSARDAANSGRLEDAADICERVLAGSPVNADAFCLLGLVSKARNSISEAEQQFQKALYLVPQHYESLVHMKLIAQHRGDEEAAANFHRRSEQAKSERSERGES